MPRAPRESGLSRRPTAVAGRPRQITGSRSTEAPARRVDARNVEAAAPRFRIFIIDSGWNSAAHQVLQENFGLIRDLQKEDPIYVLSKEQSIELIRHHQDRIGREPIIAVHDLAAMDRSGTAGFHGFR